MATPDEYIRLGKREAIVENDRSKWDSRYAGPGFFIGPNPSAFLQDKIRVIKSLCPGKRALDIACGEGRNSLFLARNEFSVTGVDISAEGLAKASRWAAAERLEIEFRQADLEEFEFVETYDLIINFNFLLRDLLPKMVAALNPGGLIVFDTILDAPSLEGAHTKAFLLQPGEIARLFACSPGKVLFCEERPLESAPTAKLIFRKKGSEDALPRTRL